MDDLVITKMRIGPPGREGMLVSLSIGTPEAPVSNETISMTVRIPMDVMDAPEAIQAQALSRCAEVIKGQLRAISEKASNTDERSSNVISIRTSMPL